MTEIQGSPRVVSMQVIPVAGHDSMLLNLSGAHGPFFTRNLVILTDSAGHTGVGEVPGGEKIRTTLEEAGRFVVGEQIGDYQRVSRNPRPFADRDTEGRGLQTFDLRITVHAVTAVESAMLDLLGQLLGVPVAALLGEGQQRTRVQALGYLFYIGDRSKTDLRLPRARPDAADDWLRLRHEEALTPEAVVGWPKRPSPATASPTSSSRAACCPATTRSKPSSPWPNASPTRASRSTPTAAGCSTKRSACAADKQDVLAYAEDPCGAEGGFSGREVMAEFRRATGLPTATNMIATDWREMGHAIRAARRRHPAGRPALLDHAGLGARRPVLRRRGD